MRRSRGVVVSEHLCTLSKNRLEEVPHVGEFALSGGPNILTHPTPHIGEDDNVLEGVVATELAEDAKVASCDFAHARVRDAVHVNHTSDLLALLVSVVRKIKFVQSQIRANERLVYGALLPCVLTSVSSSARSSSTPRRRFSRNRRTQGCPQE